VESAVSERLACRAVAQPRSTQRYKTRPSRDEPRVVKRMLQIAEQYPRYGYRRVHAILRREGWRVNEKRVHRLWQQERLQVSLRRKPRRRQRRRHSPAVQKLPKATMKNAIWAWDVIEGRTTAGKPLRWLSLIDEYTRECLALEAMRRVTARAVIDVLRGVLESRPAPQYLRSDNTRPFILEELCRWLAMGSIVTVRIAPGCPWQNAYVESFHARMRDEFLDCESFATLDEARRCTERWLRHYNHVRAHSALGYLTPSEFAEICSD